MTESIIKILKVLHNFTEEKTEVAQPFPPDKLWREFNSEFKY